MFACNDESQVLLLVSIAHSPSSGDLSAWGMPFFEVFHVVIALIIGFDV